MPPIVFEELCKAVLPAYLHNDMEKLLEKKKNAKEKDLQERIPSIHSFIEKEVQRQQEACVSVKGREKTGFEKLNCIFLEMLSFEV